MNGYKIVLLKAIFMLYRLPESERVCSGICTYVAIFAFGYIYLIFPFLVSFRFKENIKI